MVLSRAALFATSVLLLCAALAAALPARAQQAPDLFDPHDRIVRPDLSGLPRLRFLTSLDFPPFNFADEERRPSGFNVEIARALCAELQIDLKCEIQGMPWEELDPALDGLHGEAIIAGHAITAKLREERAVSLPYFRSPARFVARRSFPINGTNPTRLVRGRKVAVVTGSAHEAMLKAWFPDAVPAGYDDAPAAYKALSSGEADMIFGDGVSLAFWLASPASESCCAFVSGPFLSQHFLGPGMAIVMRKDSARIIEAINSGLAALEEKGVYREIFTRYFPLSPFAPGMGEEPSAPDEGQAERPEQSG